MPTAVAEPVGEPVAVSATEGGGAVTVDETDVVAPAWDGDVSRVHASEPDADMGGVDDAMADAGALDATPVVDALSVNVADRVRSGALPEGE